MLIALYVDDLLIAWNESRSIAWIKGKLRKRFEMKDLGEARVCLGLEIVKIRVVNQFTFRANLSGIYIVSNS